MFQNDAFGNFSTLLNDVTLSPVMGNYLDMVNNDKPNPSTNSRANENYAREILQLFTVGLDVFESGRHSATGWLGKSNSDLQPGHDHGLRPGVHGMDLSRPSPGQPPDSATRNSMAVR